MTYQEIFDIVKIHLLTQNAKAYLFDAASQYAYKTDAGLKDSIGALISDALYTPEIETKPVSDPQVLGLLKDSGVITDIQMVDRRVVLFLTQLQQIHDHHPVEQWEFVLREFANVMNLTF